VGFVFSENKCGIGIHSIYHVCETVTLMYYCGKTYFNLKNAQNLVS